MIGQMKDVISGDGMVLIPVEDYEALQLMNERARLKIRQLESRDFDEFGGIGTGPSEENRAAYIKALRWAIGIELGEV